MYELQFVPGLGWNVTSTIHDRWDVKSTGKDFEKNFKTKDAAIEYLKKTFGEDVQFVELPGGAIRWPDD